MDDKELTQLAAKAAGLIDKLEWRELRISRLGAFGMIQYEKRSGWYLPGGVKWAPLDDDGDAFRLASAIKVEVRFPDSVQVFIVMEFGKEKLRERVAFLPEAEKLAAMRRLIVRAAAEIGKGM